MKKDIFAVKHPREENMVVLIGRPGFMDKIVPFHRNLFADATIKDACVIDKNIYESIRLKCIDLGVAASYSGGTGQNAVAIAAVPEVAVVPEHTPEETACGIVLEEVKSQLNAIQEAVAALHDAVLHTPENTTSNVPHTSSDEPPDIEMEQADEEDAQNTSPAMGW
jgi:hypothetical protein